MTKTDKKQEYNLDYVELKFHTTYELERYILESKWEDFPKAVQDRALVCAVDLAMALILGSHGKQFEAGQAIVSQFLSGGTIPIIGSSKTYNVLGAAISMGHASNSYDIDDCHSLVGGHPGTAVIGCVLASALQKKVSYREFLTALVLAYEVAIRFGFAIQDHYGYFHSTGCWGSVGSAAGMGRLMGLDEKQLNNALSIAEYHAPLTPVMRAVAYPSMNKDGVPFAALIGAMAVLETLAGTTGKTHLLETENYREHVSDLGQRFRILDLGFKPYTCCRWAHSGIDAAFEVMGKEGFTHEEIERVDVKTFERSAALSKIIPKDTDEAQYNIAYPIAAGIVYGDVGYDQVKDEVLDGPEVINIMERMKFVVDPVYEEKYPHHRLTSLEFELKDGRQYVSEAFEPRGEPADNVDMLWIREKASRILKPFLDEGAQNRLFALMSNADGSIFDIVTEINEMLL